MSNSSTDSTNSVEIGDYVSVRGWEGIAFYVHKWKQIWEPVTFLATDDEGEEYEEDSGEGEWIDDPSHEWVICIMVGDDREHEFEVSELTKLHDEDFCGGCGQIGCKAYG